ncbi:hypothetical protein Pst134EA_031991 [Puccinia striiformis f. sp. tritici]|uniref:uncharacterized protein n=1 Tax=Puccinia striiformis f. sp. tritici TaxID=168172 RepID=UPI002008C03F|nr:uncharacterized protein Pst134EA_031991 [Puccinia striiformis f. sp. tritici]KAH9441947.1 hypothetical protein Pst134EA_031991 [Puccinia striiformis f. sp. tritici]
MWLHQANPLPSILPKLQPIPGSAGGGGKLPPLSEAEKASLIEKSKAKAAAGGTPGASLGGPPIKSEATKTAKITKRAETGKPSGNQPTVDPTKPKTGTSPTGGNQKIPGSGNNKPTQKHPEGVPKPSWINMASCTLTPVLSVVIAMPIPLEEKGSSKPLPRSLLHLAPAAATQMGDELMILIQTSPFIPLFLLRVCQ